MRAFLCSTKSPENGECFSAGCRLNSRHQEQESLKYLYVWEGIKLNISTKSSSQILGMRPSNRKLNRHVDVTSQPCAGQDLARFEK